MAEKSHWITEKKDPLASPDLRAPVQGPVERVSSHAFHASEKIKLVVRQLNSRPMRLLGSYLLLAGVLCLIYFGFRYDTTQIIQSGGDFGIPKRLRQIHNVGKQQDRLLGFIGGIAAAGIGIMLIALDANQSTTKKDT